MGSRARTIGEAAKSRAVCPFSQSSCNSERNGYLGGWCSLNQDATESVLGVHMRAEFDQQ